MGTQSLITPTTLDYGPVHVGTTSPTQAVTVTNIGPSAVVMSGAGGGVGSPFSGSQSCQGKTLNPGDSCQMVYSFTPTAAGPATTTSSGDWNGQNFNISLTGLSFALAPTLSAITPPNGPVAGGQSGTLTGTNLTATSAVTFGGPPPPSSPVLVPAPPNPPSPTPP